MSKQAKSMEHVVARVCVCVCVSAVSLLLSYYLRALASDE